MKRSPAFLLSLASILILSACGPGRVVQKYSYLTEDLETKTRQEEEVASNSDPVSSKDEAPTRRPKRDKEVDLIVETAMSYEGVPYKYGGLSRKGMDCSGLVYTSYLAVDRRLPRTTSQLAATGTPVSLKKLEPGHVVLFAAKGGRRIDHAGLVVDVSGDEVSFIHATSSAGVRVDLLSNPYWKTRVVKAVRF